jgi:hypothetical protein
LELQAKENLPRTAKLFEWGLVKPGDILYISTCPSETAEVIDGQKVKYKGQVMTFNAWGQTVTGWSAINIYEWAHLSSSDKSLDELRRAKMEELNVQSAKASM